MNSRSPRTLRPGLSIALLAVFLPAQTAFSPSVAAQMVTVSPEQAIFYGGSHGPNTPQEAQSTVVAPRLKPQCPAGRILVSNDWQRPDDPPTVVGRDLNAPNDGSMDVESTFGPPDQAAYNYGSNDHDLVSDARGNVFYAIGAWSDAPITEPPLWFLQTARGNFGPGARTNLMLWRSTDCGKTFTFASQFDPARQGDGSCAYPQLPSAGEFPTPAPNAKPMWDMGGSDGQLVKAVGNTLYLTFGCVGYVPNSTSPWIISASPPPTPLNRTIVAASIDGGDSWTTLGTAGFEDWRIGVTTAPEWKEMILALGLTGAFVEIPINTVGQWDFEETKTVTALSSARPYYGRWSNGSAIAGIEAHTVVGRSAEGADMLAPDVANGVDELRHFHYDVIRRQLTEGTPFSPNEAGGYPLHPVAVECGDTTLFVWNDVNPATNTATVYGFLPFKNTQYPIGTQMVVSMNGNGTVRAFRTDSTSGNLQYWFGDYQTAGCYETTDTEGGLVRSSYHFFPIWTENDGNVHYAQIVYTPLPVAQGGSGQNQEQLMEQLRVGLPRNAKLISGATIRPLRSIPTSTLPKTPVIGQPKAVIAKPSPPPSS